MVQCQFTISRPNIKIASVLAFSCVGKNLLQYRLRKKVDVKLTLTYFGDTVEKKPRTFERITYGNHSAKRRSTRRSRYVGMAGGGCGKRKQMKKLHWQCCVYELCAPVKSSQSRLRLQTPSRRETDSQPAVCQLNQRRRSVSISKLSCFQDASECLIARDVVPLARSYACDL